MSKISAFAVLVGLAIVVAGLFGALHNQLSYSVAPSYFHDLKFQQFAIDAASHNRWGAALVGWKASWWMGALVGLPAFLLGLFTLARGQTLLTAGIGAIVAVVTVTLMASLGGLVFGQFFLTEDIALQMPLPDGLSDPLSFVRAGLMHEMSYYGGAFGALIAVWTIWRARKWEAKHAA